MINRNHKIIFTVICPSGLAVCHTPAVRQFSSRGIFTGSIPAIQSDLMKSKPNSKKPRQPDESVTGGAPPSASQLHDRTDALADGLRKSHREGDMRDREYARQMQEITREGVE